MGDVTDFPTATGVVLQTLEIAAAEADAAKATHCAVLLEVGDEVHAICSKDYTHKDWFGLLGVAAMGATVNYTLSLMGVDDEG